MTPESKICQNCKQSFTIEPDDFSFYEKIKVPPPTWCPECRQQRRYSWRNERVLYRRTCDLCGKSTVTIYSPNKPFKVYCPPCWWSDKWDAKEFGRDFDFQRPFFPQWQELQLRVPRIALLTKNSTRSEYTNHSNNNKDCYLCFGVFDSENVLYSANTWKSSRDSMDCYHIDEGMERTYECIDSHRLYQCQYGMYMRDCNNCSYCFDCRGCSSCFLCWNLRGKQYHILNQPYSKEDYQKKIKDFNLGSYASRQKLYEQFLSLIKNTALHRFAIIEKSKDCSGNIIVNSKNSHYVFDADGAEDTKYGIVCPDVKDTMDSYHYGFKCELNYETHALIHAYDVMFSHLCYDNSHIQYCDGCHNSNNLFGCVGMKQSSYCIFNRTYSEEEYMTLKDKIIAYMKTTGEYGEFFSPELSPFGYNETQGMVYMPLSKQEVLARTWKWEDLEPGTFGKETLKPEDIPDHINDVPDTIIKEALRCINCSRNYNVVAPELALYRREIIPVPRLCPDCRYRRRIALRLPRKLWSRQCAKCNADIQTSYAPDRPEIVYCEQCYQQEVI